MHSVQEEPTGSRNGATVAAVAPSNSQNFTADDLNHRPCNTHTNTGWEKGVLEREAIGNTICMTMARKPTTRTKHVEIETSNEKQTSSSSEWWLLYERGGSSSLDNRGKKQRWMVHGNKHGTWRHNGPKCIQKQTDQSVWDILFTKIYGQGMGRQRLKNHGSMWWKISSGLIKFKKAH